MNSVPILDARQALQIDLRGVTLIEASAGTGKTYTIANLYLRQILEGRQPGQILVVSFTNAATDELQQRIHARLYQAAKMFASGVAPQDEFLALLLEQFSALIPAEQDARKRYLQFALRGMDESAISTIHGFCQSALQDHALLSNRRFETDITADDDALWESALRDWWRRSSYPLSRAEWQLFNQAIPAFKKLALWQKDIRTHARDSLIPEIATPLDSLLQQYRDLEPDSDAFDAAIRLIRARALSDAHQFARRQVARVKQDSARLAYQDQLDLLLEALEQANGPALARHLRARFPVAMIDEFQDTDATQFGIFRRLYFDQDDTSLTLIGDPKQAIYGFRGGDIFTYIDSRDETGVRIYALQTNWRSRPELVDAVNRFFTHRDAPFIYDQAIGFSPAHAAASNSPTRMTENGQETRALTLWRIPLTENGRKFSVADMQRHINLALSAEISRLLDPSSDARLDERTLKAGDIAVLVRDRNEGNALRATLADAGIRSVSIGREKVFDSDEARGLYDLLEGIAHPGDDRMLRKARASNLFGLDYRQLAAIIDDDLSWQHWIDQLQNLRDYWIATGFIAMYQQLLEVLDLGNALATRDFAERRLTNLSHLAEMLQQQSRAAPGIEALLSWFRVQLHSDPGEEAELRLESDAELVKIVTVHKSKGLEYPVVFLPFMWRCRLATKNTLLLRYHDDSNRAFFDLGSDDFEQHRFITEKERLAEDLRLLYVALTRARTRVYLAWGDVGDGRSAGQPKHSALAYLLHSSQSPRELSGTLPNGFDDAAGILAEIQAFGQSCDNIDVVDLPAAAAASRAQESAAPPPELQARVFSRQPGPGWRINSFSGLTRDVHQVAHPGEITSQGDAILDFPAGSHVGLLLHELLEHVDFERDIHPQAGAMIAARAPAYGIYSENLHRTLADWLQAIVETRLDPNGLSLSALSGARRLNELKFDFALDHFDVDAFNRLLQQDSPVPLQPITAAGFKGLLTGVIDLVFEFEGRYYLADYKSNFLGTSLEDYLPERLAQAMFARRYDLQALLYAVALQRYLAQRLPDYSYDRHFGGCYYLFLRALRPQSGNRHGVSYTRPARAKLDAVEQLLAFTPAGVDGA